MDILPAVKVRGGPALGGYLELGMWGLGGDFSIEQILLSR